MSIFCFENLNKKREFRQADRNDGQQKTLQKIGIKGNQVADFLKTSNERT